MNALTAGVALFDYLPDRQNLIARDRFLFVGLR
jgi:tetrahydromethanopterin S-methyltransferase subunit F